MASPAGQFVRELRVNLSINRKVVFGLTLAVIVIVILMFDTAIDLFLELIHVSFELLEHSLDMLIEHVFHTDRHSTQVIVFYLLLSIAALLLYQLYKQLRTLPRRYYGVKDSLISVWSQLKIEALEYWQDLPLARKAKWLAGIIASFSFMVLWLFN
jgi:hypothetical protein